MVRRRWEGGGKVPDPILCNIGIMSDVLGFFFYLLGFVQTFVASQLFNPSTLFTR